MWDIHATKFKMELLSTIKSIVTYYLTIYILKLQRTLFQTVKDNKTF